MPSLSLPDNFIATVSSFISGSFDGLSGFIYLVLGLQLFIFGLEFMIRLIGGFIRARTGTSRPVEEVNPPGHQQRTTQDIRRSPDTNLVDLSGDQNTLDLRDRE